MVPKLWNCTTYVPKLVHYFIQLWEHETNLIRSEVFQWESSIAFKSFQVRTRSGNSCAPLKRNYCNLIGLTSFTSTPNSVKMWHNLKYFATCSFFLMTDPQCPHLATSQLSTFLPLYRNRALYMCVSVYTMFNSAVSNSKHKALNGRPLVNNVLENNVVWYSTRLIYGTCLEKEEKPGKTSVTSQTLVIGATAWANVV